MQRTRTRTGELLSNRVTYKCWIGTGTPNYSSVNPDPIRLFDAFIVDDPSKIAVSLPDGSRPLRPKFVDHVHWEFDPNFSPFTYQFGPSSYCTSSSVCGTAGDIDHANVSASLASFCAMKFVHPNSGHYDRWMNCRPTMQTRANMSVFLAELTDVKRMFEIIPKRHFSLSDWPSVLKYANGQHLNYNFGWKPFVRDLKAFSKAKTTFDDRLNRFISDQNKNLDRSWSDETEISEVVERVTVNTSWRWRMSISGSIKQRSQFRYTYSTPYSDGDLRWRAWMDSLGLDLSPQNVWAVLPWSFVVDWFFDVSKCLGSLKRDDWTRPYVDLSLGLMSTNLKLDCRLDIARSPYWTWYHAGTLNFSHYMRCTGMPSLTIDDVTSGLTADKIRLLASLVAARL